MRRGVFAHCCSVGPGVAAVVQTAAGVEVEVGQRWLSVSYTQRLQLEAVRDSGADRETALHHVRLFLLAAVAAVGSGGCIPAS